MQREARVFFEMNHRQESKRAVSALRAIALTAIVAVAFSAAPVRSQVLGPGLERHRLEVGYTFKWYERDFESRYLGQEDWSTGAFYIRYGVCRWATMSFEGGIWTVEDDDFAGIDYERYTLGGGLTVRLWERPDWRIEISGHYSEIFDHDPSATQFHKNVRDMTAVLQVERTVPVRDQELIVWAGPAVVYNQSRQYPWQTTESVKNDTSNNLGFALGMNALLFERVDVFAHGVYADTFQPRLGAAVRF